MRIAIMQPTYLPWLGYFDLFDRVDRFVFLDCVQLEKRSWQQRNRIKGPDGLELLTVPVRVRGRFEQRIDEAEIVDARFWDKHLKAFELRYRRAPFFHPWFDAISSLFGTRGVPAHLADLNVALVEWLGLALGVRVPIQLRASGLGVGGKRSELLASICESLGADEYLSPMGSRDYLLAEAGAFTSRGIRVVLQDYRHPPYHQLFPPFAEHACALDLLFNEGPRAAEIIRSGHGEVALEPLFAAREEGA